MGRKKFSEIIIDEGNGLVFKTEDELLSHFKKDIEALESHYHSHRSQKDIAEKDAENYEEYLEPTLNQPDEIWKNHSLIDGATPSVYIKVFEGETEDDDFYYVAVTYLTEEIPSFIFLHFPTNDLDLVERYRAGELVYSRKQSEAPEGAVEGDALMEGDEFANGLYEAMLLLRSSKDIVEGDFASYANLREETIEQADEIWRKPDSLGNILVYFIKDFSDEEMNNLHYIVVTVEEPGTNSHALLFSFPTTDSSLLERYRQGENLQAEQVVQENSH